MQRPFLYLHLMVMPVHLGRLKVLFRTGREG